MQEVRMSYENSLDDSLQNPTDTLRNVIYLDTNFENLSTVSGL